MDRLRQLPPRGIVAFATHCCYRIQEPKLQDWQRRLIAKCSNHGSQLAAGTRVKALDARSAAVELLDSLDKLEWESSRAIAAVEVAWAAALTVEAIEAARPQLAAYCAAIAKHAWAVHELLEEDEKDAAICDLQRIREFCALETDATGHGPLITMDPEGPLGKYEE